MKFNKKTVLLPLLLVALVGSSINFLHSSTSGTFEGRVLVAGLGGHIADAEVVINPRDEKHPIKIPSYWFWSGKKLNNIEVGVMENHALHDVRLDRQNPNTVFWSTYDSMDASTIVGKADLQTDRWVAEKKLPLPDEVVKFGKCVTKTLYCGSGQTERYYIPIFMGYPGFIDVIDKKTLELKRRVMLASSTELPRNYTYVHGVTSPDYRYLFLALNGADGPFGKLTGVQYFYLLDLPALVETGEIKILKKNILTFHAGTVTFRPSFTPNGKYILQSGRTRTIVLRTDDLGLVQQIPVPEGMENHDLAPLDDRYAISTLRVPIDYEGGEIIDGQIWLYDIASNKYLGKMVSVCQQCHLEKNQQDQFKETRKMNSLLGDTKLCGVDVLLGMK